MNEDRRQLSELYRSLLEDIREHNQLVREMREATGRSFTDLDEVSNPSFSWAEWESTLVDIDDLPEVER